VRQHTESGNEQHGIMIQWRLSFLSNEGYDMCVNAQTSACTGSSLRGVGQFIPETRGKSATLDPLAVLCVDDDEDPPVMLVTLIKDRIR